MSTVADAAIKQMQVIHALALRETRTRFGQHQLGYVWALVEPILWIGTFYIIYAFAHRTTPQGMDLASFLATGFVPYMCFSKTLEMCAASINGNKPLLYFPQVQTLDLIAARTYLEFTTSVVVFFLIMGGRSLIAGNTDVDSMLDVILGLGLASLLGAAGGLVFCTIGVVNHTVDRLRNVILRPMFWLSGIFYMINTLPLRAQQVLSYNPVLHVVELVRDGWHTSYTSPVIDVAYVVKCILVLLFIGLTFERRIRHRIHAE